MKRFGLLNWLLLGLIISWFGSVVAIYSGTENCTEDKLTITPKYYSANIEKIFDASIETNEIKTKIKETQEIAVEETGLLSWETLFSLSEDSNEDMNSEDEVIQ